MTAAPGFDPDTFVEVRLLALPVDIWSRTQQHTDELLREFTLLTQQLRQHPEEVASTPVRLIELVEELTQTYAGISSDQESQLFAAAADGDAVIDELVFHVPPAVVGAVEHLDAMLDEADDYCRAGRHLLTLATPAELVRFRKWYLDEFTRQIAGNPPTPWPDYRG